MGFILLSVGGLIPKRGGGREGGLGELGNGGGGYGNGWDFRALVLIDPSKKTIGPIGETERGKKIGGWGRLAHLKKEHFWFPIAL